MDLFGTCLIIGNINLEGLENPLRSFLWYLPLLDEELQKRCPLMALHFDQCLFGLAPPDAPEKRHL